MISNFGKRRAAAPIEREDPLVRLAGGDAFHRSSDPKADIDGTSGDDTIDGTGGDDHINGLGGNDILNGLGGNDRLDGGAGLDTMRGGVGDDEFIVESGGDIIEELAGEGFDRAYMAVDYTLAAGVSVEMLAPIDILSLGPLNFTGNEIANTLYGNAGTNVLSGGGGNDALFGNAGTDTLNGDDGNDFLDGGAGTDEFHGGTGDDVFIADGGGSAQDVVFENPGEGFDIVYLLPGGSMGLREGSEIEIVSAADVLSTAPMAVSGNSFSNTIYGNAGQNTLEGLDGNDALFGLAGPDELRGGNGNDFIDGGPGIDSLNGGVGDDILFVDNLGDVIVEAANQGLDRVYVNAAVYALSAGAHVEVLSSIDSLANLGLSLTGNSFNNAVYGDAGNNILDGGAGNDYMLGLGGADTFAFTTGLGVYIDQIGDFQAGVDKILLSSYVYADARTDTMSTVFESSAGGAATRPDARVIYNPLDGILYYDFDGSGIGQALYIGLVQSAPPLQASDFTATASVGPGATADAATLASGQTHLEINVLGNDTNPGGGNLFIASFGQARLTLVGGGLSPTVIATQYGQAYTGRASNGFTYDLNTNDPDYVALAPGAHSETFFYLVSNGTASSMGKVTINFTKPAPPGIQGPAPDAADGVVVPVGAFLPDGASAPDPLGGHWQQVHRGVAVDLLDLAPNAGAVFA